MVPFVQRIPMRNSREVAQQSHSRYVAQKRGFCDDSVRGAAAPEHVTRHRGNLNISRPFENGFTEPYSPTSIDASGGVEM